MKATEQRLSVVLSFMLYKAVSTVESGDEIHNCDNSGKDEDEITNL